MLDVYEMQIFLTVAETGSFSEAGRRLQMSQPAVSMQIRTLEKRLDARLFHRAGRHISLTETGETLIPMARELVNLSRQIQENLNAMHGEVTGMLRIGCSTTAGKYLLPRLFAGFIEQHPRVRVTCHVTGRENAIGMLLNGKVDISVTSLTQPVKDLEYRPFVTDRVVLIAPPNHPWSRTEAITVNDLCGGRFIMRERDSGTQQAVTGALAEHDMTPDDLPTVMILENSEAIYMAVAEGIGVAFISQRAALDGIAAGRVVMIPVEDLDMVQQLYLVRPLAAMWASAPEAFWDYVYSAQNDALLGRFVEAS